MPTFEVLHTLDVHQVTSMKPLYENHRSDDHLVAAIPSNNRSRSRYSRGTLSSDHKSSRTRGKFTHFTDGNKVGLPLTNDVISGSRISQTSPINPTSVKNGSMIYHPFTDAMQSISHDLKVLGSGKRNSNVELGGTIDPTIKVTDQGQDCEENDHQCLSIDDNQAYTRHEPHQVSTPTKELSASLPPTSFSKYNGDGRLSSGVEVGCHCRRENVPEKLRIRFGKLDTDRDSSTSTTYPGQLLITHGAADYVNKLTSRGVFQLDCACKDSTSPTGLREYDNRGVRSYTINPDSQIIILSRVKDLNATGPPILEDKYPLSTHDNVHGSSSESYTPKNLSHSSFKLHGTENARGIQKPRSTSSHLEQTTLDIHSTNQKKDVFKERPLSKDTYVDHSLPNSSNTCDFVDQLHQNHSIDIVKTGLSCEPAKTSQCEADNNSPVNIFSNSAGIGVDIDYGTRSTYDEDFETGVHICNKAGSYKCIETGCSHHNEVRSCKKTKSPLRCLLSEATGKKSSQVSSRALDLNPRNQERHPDLCETEEVKNEDILRILLDPSNKGTNIPSTCDRSTPELEPNSILSDNKAFHAFASEFIETHQNKSTVNEEEQALDRYILNLCKRHYCNNAIDNFTRGYNRNTKTPKILEHICEIYRSVFVVHDINNKEVKCYKFPIEIRPLKDCHKNSHLQEVCVIPEFYENEPLCLHSKSSDSFPVTHSSDSGRCITNPKIKEGKYNCGSTLSMKGIHPEESYLHAKCSSPCDNRPHIAVESSLKNLADCRGILRTPTKQTKSENTLSTPRYSSKYIRSLKIAKEVFKPYHQLEDNPSDIPNVYDTIKYPSPYIPAHKSTTPVILESLYKPKLDSPNKCMQTKIAHIDISIQKDSSPKLSSLQSAPQTVPGKTAYAADSDTNRYNWPRN